MTHYKSGLNSRPDHLAVLDIETIAPPVADEGFPPWATHSVIVVSILIATKERYGEWQFKIETVDFLSGEPAAIERVSHLIEGRNLLTFNGRGFDIPVLALTAMKHQRFDLAGISRAWQSHRFSGRHHDLADIVSGYGGARGSSLEMLCSQLGIPAKQDTHGGDVAELVAKREFRKIREYCESDVAATLALFACVEGLRSRDAAYAGSLISQLGRWIADSGLAHLRAFERMTGHDEYDRLSLLNMVEEGVAALDHRQHMKFVANVSGPSGVFAPKHSDF
jgi:predicted PolB exonuclease-like 3'-5' exonuclease